jgi:hypothetical protein
MEETFTDKEFCKQFKVDRATSARWRQDGVVGYVKLPNGQIRYRQRHIDELWERFEKSTSSLKNSKGAVEGRVIKIGVTEGRGNVGVA